MAMQSIKSRYDVKSSVAPAGNRTTSTNGSGVDVSNLYGAMVVFVPGTITDGTHTPKVQESSDNSTFTDVAAGDLDGTLSALASSTEQRVSYLGTKQYIRAVVTVTGSPGTGGIYGAHVVRAHARKQPMA